MNTIQALWIMFFISVLAMLGILFIVDKVVKLKVFRALQKRPIQTPLDFDKKKMDNLYLLVKDLSLNEKLIAFQMLLGEFKCLISVRDGRVTFEQIASEGEIVFDKDRYLADYTG